MKRWSVTILIVISALLGVTGVLLVVATARSAADSGTHPATTPAAGVTVSAGPAESPARSSGAFPNETVNQNPAVVVIGASIAGGYRTSTTAPWPRLVDAQLEPTAGDNRSGIRIVDAWVSATSLLTDSAGGPSYRHRLPAALDVPGTKAVLITDLINDIQAPPHVTDPARIENGLRDIVELAHHHGVVVIATTITPYGGYHYTADQQYNAAGEACRQAVNDALRAGDLVDQVIDLDRALADPTDPHRLDPLFDSGDHLHPNDTGHLAIADHVSRALITTLKLNP